MCNSQLPPAKCFIYRSDNETKCTGAAITKPPRFLLSFARLLSPRRLQNIFKDWLVEDIKVKEHDNNNYGTQ